MILRWQEMDEYGNTVVRDSNNINVDNVKGYAKRSCRQCYGRGTQEIDHGYRLRRMVINDNISIVRERYAVAIVACQCVLNKLNREKTGAEKAIEGLSNERLG